MREEPVTRAALGPRVYSEIKRDILTCVLRPSQVVYEAELAQHYGVSKTPIREALHALQQEGYVDIVPRRGYIVAPVSIHDVQQVLNLRLILEPAAAELASQQATPQQIRQLRRLAQRTDGQRSGGLFVVDRAFHLAVAEASGNARLAQCVAKLLEEIERLYNLCESLRGASRPGRNRHVQLVDAIAAGDAQLARETMVETVQESRLRVLEALLGGDTQVRAPVLISSAPGGAAHPLTCEQAPTQIRPRRR
jgi:DNA-binding GntR family transcriptional regulator